MKIMSNLDCDVLARCISAESEYIKVSNQIKKIRFLPDTKSGISPEGQIAEQYERYDFLSRIQARYMKACNEATREMGLTIASRCRLVVPKKVPSHLTCLNFSLRRWIF